MRPGEISLASRGVLFLDTPEPADEMVDELLFESVPPRCCQRMRQVDDPSTAECVLDVPVDMAGLAIVGARRAGPLLILRARRPAVRLC